MTGPHYVVASNRRRTECLLGPFATREEAHSWVRLARFVAVDRDTRFRFYRFEALPMLLRPGGNVPVGRMNWEAGYSPVPALLEA